MKIKLLFLLIFGLSGFAAAESGYTVLVTVKDAESELVFPAFDVLKANKSGSSRVDDCTYLGRLTEQDGASLLLEGQMSCAYADGNTHMDMPIFILSSKGDSASIALGDIEAGIWTYSVELKVRP